MRVKNVILFICTKQDLALVKETVLLFLSSLFNINQLHPILPVLLHVGIRDGSSTQLTSPPSLPYWKHAYTVEMTGSCLLSPPKEKEVHFQNGAVLHTVYCTYAGYETLYFKEYQSEFVGIRD